MSHTSSPGALPAFLPGPLSPRVLLYQANAAAMLAGQTDLTPEVTAGVNSGQGNQGSQNTAHLVGQAGTACDRFSVPRQMHFGAGIGVSRP